MMNRLIISLCLLSFALFAHAQHKIEIEVGEYQNDTLIIGYYLGERTLVQDTLIKKKSGKFEMKGEEDLDAGVYMLLTKPDDVFYQFMINDEDQEFKIKADSPKLKNIIFKGSEENQVFSDYITFLSSQKQSADPLRKAITIADSSGVEVKEEKEKLNLIDKAVRKMQMDIIKKYPTYPIALLIKANMEVDIPDFEGSKEDIQTQRYQFYKTHYFDNVELDNPTSLRTPFFHKKIEYYVEKLTPFRPDSLAASIDYILEKVDSSETTYQYYLSHYLNKYAKSKMIGMDAIYVHLVDKYYAKGLAPWVDEETLLKITDNADKLRPVLIGKTAKDITVYLQDGTPIALDDIEYEFLVLYFWAPDCPHCKKSTPHVVDFYEKYKDKGIKVLAICAKHQEKLKDCWEELDGKNMNAFINAGDEMHKSRFKLKYNVSSTPKIFVLDKNKEILIKNFGAEHLPEVIDELIKKKQKEEK